jgi:hypothetical protein
MLSDLQQGDGHEEEEFALGVGGGTTGAEKEKGVEEIWAEG